MTVSKIIKEQMDVFANLDKRFSETLKPDTFQSRITGLTKDQEDRITGRIQKLEAQKTAAVARYDAAILEEKKALELVKSQRLTTNPTNELKDTKRTPTPAKRRTGTATTKKTTATKKASAKTTPRKK